MTAAIVPSGAGTCTCTKGVLCGPCKADLAKLTPNAERKPWWQMNQSELKAAAPSVKDCPRCGGSGEELVPLGRFASEPDDYRTCSKCHGTGWL